MSGEAGLSQWTPARELQPALQAHPQAVEGDWLAEPVLGTLPSTSWCALTRSPTDAITLVYHDPTTDGLRRARTLPGTPGREIVDGVDDKGAYSALVRAPDGTLHALYRDSAATALRHARKIPGQPWETEEVDNAANVGEWVSAVMGSSGER